MRIERTTLFGAIAAVGAALSGTALTEIAPEALVELVPQWAKQMGAIMFLVGLALSHHFAADKSEISKSVEVRDLGPRTEVLVKEEQKTEDK